MKIVNEMMNMVQYVLLAIIPAILILKAVKLVVPEEDDSKGSFEIAAECIAQIAFIVLAIYFSLIKQSDMFLHTAIVNMLKEIFSFLLPFVILYVYNANQTWC